MVPACGMTPTHGCANLLNRARRSVTTFTKSIGSSTIKEVTQFAGTASDWSTNQLQQWGLIGEDRAANLRTKGLRLGRFIPYKNRAGNGPSAAGSGVDGKRPLGISLDLSAFFGGNSHSLYSAPAAGKTRKPGYRGEPVIPVRPALPVYPRTVPVGPFE